VLKLLGFSSQCVVAGVRRNNFACHETIFPLGCRYPETAVGYQTAQQNGSSGSRPGDQLMRTLSFILAFAFVLAGPSLAGSTDTLPGAGTFAYNGTPAANSAPFIVAAR
jgi:hypothetical protein